MSRKRMVVIGGIAIAMLVAGCNTGSENAGNSPDVPSISGAAGATEAAPPPAPSSQVPPPSAAPAPTSAPPAKLKPATNPADCKVGELKLSLAGGDAAAGTVYRELRFTNIGGRDCVIHGFPGVSYVAGDDGHQVGPAAFRDGKKGPAITLKPGRTVFAPVGFVQVRNYDPAVCKPTEVRGLRVYPPHEYDSMYVPAPGTGCAGIPPGNQLTVQTIR